MDNCSAILSFISTLIIGGVATYVAWQQWKINQQKLKLDLYDRRVRIYEEVKAILHKGMQGSTISHVDLANFWTAASQADFLFKEEIPTYIDEIHRHGVKLHYWHSIYRDWSQPPPPPPGYDHEAVANGIRDETLWFSEQLDAAREKFRKYLSLKA